MMGIKATSTVHILWMVLLLSVLPSAWADVVFLTDNSTVEGKVTRKDGKVHVQTTDGQTRVFDEAEVLYVTEGSIRTEDPMGDTPEPDTTPTRPKRPPSSPSAWDELPTVPSSEPMWRLTHPHSILYVLMRRRPAGPGSGGVDLKRRIEQYRVNAHDNLRRIDGKWYDPEDFQRGRRTFLQRLEEAEEELKEARRLDDDDEVLQRQAHLRSAQQKLSLASKVWTDPLLRDFLQAAAELEYGNATKAERFFRDCIDEAPQVAAFHQGRADALFRMERYDDALEAYMTLLRLRPQSRDAVHMLRNAIETCPGALTRHETFQKARELLREYEETREARSSDKTYWLLPGKRISTRYGELPTPLMDRLLFRQALAVPVEDHALLLDAEVLEDALEVYVDTGDGAWVQCGFRERRRDDSPLQAVSLEEYTLAPPPRAKVLPTANQQARAFTVNSMVEMGTQPRRIDLSATLDADGNVSWNNHTAAGESAAPVFDAEGTLLGFLAGKHRAETDDNPDRFIAPEIVEEAVDDARNRSTGRADRSYEPQPLEGRVFRVVVIGYELWPIED